MPVDGNGTQALLLMPRFEHEPPVGVAIAQAKARFVTLAPVVLVTRRVPTLAQPSAVHRLGNDLPNLPPYAIAVCVLTMRHAYPQVQQ